MGIGGSDHDDRHDPPADDDEPYAPRGLPPDPLDRLWLHPSELSSLAAPPSPARARPMWTATLVAGAAGALLTLGVLGAVGALGRPPEQSHDSQAVPTSAPIVTAQKIALTVEDSVVAVSAYGRDGTRRGSGVCIRPSGEVLTSDRLVGRASKIAVTTADGIVHSASVLGRDATTDLVLLRVASAGSVRPTIASDSQHAGRSGVPAPFSSREARTGDTMWVVGAPSPGDSSPWMSSGLVASTDSVVATNAGPTTSGLLETAAPSNIDSSGGALVDLTGDVTGIVLAPVGNDRMTYAVPIATALEVAGDLRTHGYAVHGALGVNGIDAPDGPTVTALVADGPAARAGVHVGDVIEAVDDHDVYTMDEIMARVRHDRPGQPIGITLERGSRTLHVSARLSSMVTP